jgi:hypothetical protein
MEGLIAIARISYQNKAECRRMAVEHYHRKINKTEKVIYEFVDNCCM